MKPNRTGFTLVELIVVVTILAILGTIGFISYNGYLVGVRDSNRLSQLQQLASGIELYRAKNQLFLPDSSVPVKAGGNVIAYQGFLGQSQLDLLDYSKGGKDPKDGEYFTYYVTSDRKLYQLLGFLEDSTNQASAFINKTYAADYSNRFATTTGKKLGVLTDAGTNLPIQYLSLPSGIDLLTTTGSYTAVLSDKQVISGTGRVLQSLQYTILGGKGIASSCYNYLRGNSVALAGKDGTYFIQPSDSSAPFQVYCDMTTDGGGYTLYPVDAGIQTFKTTDNNSCKGLKMDLVIPRTKAHFGAMIAKYGISYFTTIPGIYKSSDGGNFTNVAMNSVTAPARKALDGGQWWIRDTTHTEPNGNYTAYCRLGVRSASDVNNITFDDNSCNFFTTKYLCSTNDK